jgi:hypothetical protein
MQSMVPINATPTEYPLPSLNDYPPPSIIDNIEVITRMTG